MGLQGDFINFLGFFLIRIKKALQRPIRQWNAFIHGAVEQTRTAEPLPYQGSALPPELQQHITS